MQKSQYIERSIIKKFRTKIWRQFVIAVDQYDLVKDGDKIAVCISGGKDSMLLAKCFQELQRRSPVKFELVFLVMDPGYNPINRQIIIDNAALMDVPIDIFQSDIFDVVANVEQSPCYLCARMRRGFLYKNAQLRGCNKIALGHHLDDAVETILLSMIYGAEYKTMMPKLKSANYSDMQLIRPMYMIRERDIIAWSKYNELTFIACACKLTASLADNPTLGGSKRAEMKALVAQLEHTYPNAARNIFHSVHNVNLNAIIGTTKDGVKSNFLEEY